MRDWLWEHNRHWQITWPLIALCVAVVIVGLIVGDELLSDVAVLAGAGAALLPS